MGRSLVALILLLSPASAADIDITSILKGVENRYNHAKTLEVGFSETYIIGRRTSPTESGQLFLRKPGRMRWDYRQPSGKLFVSDGKNVYLYSPDTKRAEKMPLKETEDMRAPLAFLLGRLDFQKDFGQFSAKPDGADTAITAIPKSDKLPYTQVSFVVTSSYEIRKLVVTGQDQSILEYHFDGEKLNPVLNDKLFRFTLPPGVEFVDSTQGNR